MDDKYLDVLIAETRAAAGTPWVDEPDWTEELFDRLAKALELLKADKAELSNRLWAVERRSHAFDPWESEAEDA